MRAWTAVVMRTVIWWLLAGCLVNGVVEWHREGLTPRPVAPREIDAMERCGEALAGAPVPATIRQQGGGKRRERERHARRAAKRVKKEGREYKSPCTDDQLAKRKTDCDHCCVRLRCDTRYEEWQVRKIMDFWHSADIPTRRHFVAQRIVPAQTEVDPEADEVLIGRAKYFYYMDHPEAITPTTVIGIQPARHQGELLRVCTTFFCWMGPSKSMIHQDKVKCRPVHGHFDADVHAHAARDLQVDTATYQAGKWLQDLAQYYLADPTQEGVVYLPFANKGVVYSLYLADSYDEAYSQYFRKGVLQYKSFCKAWREDKKLKRNIRLHKWLKFSLCDDCVRFREERKRTADPKKLEAIRKEELQHRCFIRGERRSYMDRREEAADPVKRDHVMSIIIDGADQAAYGLPYHCTTTHSVQGKHKIKGHLMGAIVHGRGVYGFVGVDNVKYGTNVTIETLHRILLDQAKRGPLPDHLYLQLDNTAKQCKSRFLLGWLGCLVKWGVFKNIYVSFLPVGHTHEDIDQMFSRLATYLRFHDARSRAEMCRAIQLCYHDKNGKQPKAGPMDNVANISDWLDKRLAPTSSTATRDGLMCFRQFWIKLHKGQPVFKCRANCAQGEVWRGLETYSKRHTIFKQGQCPTPQDLSTVPPAQRPSRPTKVCNDNDAVASAAGDHDM